jgi:hypothetical protein
VKLLLSRYVAGLLLAAGNIFYLIISMWLIVMWKTHVVHMRFLVAAPIILFVVATLLAFAFLIGVVTSSTAVSIMTSYALFFFGFMLAAHKQYAALVSKEWQAAVIHTLYWIVPKSAELFAAVVSFVSDKALPRQMATALTPAPFLATAAFLVGCLSLASWLFYRKEF